MTPATVDAAGAARGPGRRGPVLAGIALGVAVLVVTSTVWVRATTSSAVDPDVPVAVAGGVVAPGASAGGLVVLAAACALALGGRWGRWLAAGGVGLGGALVVAASVGALADAEAPARAAARAAVGVARLDHPATLTVMPWVALLLGAAAVALGVRAGFAARGWGDPSARHEGASGAVRVVPPSTAGPSAAPPSVDHQAPRGHVLDTPDGIDEHAAWDALSRGDDPT